MNLVCSVVRGSVLRASDDNLNAADVEASIAAFKDKKLYDVGEDRGGITTDEEARHAREDAFNVDNSGWWADGGDVGETGLEREKIFRAAYIRALEIKKERYEESDGEVVKTIHTVWVRGLDRVEAYIVELEATILIQWLTPDVPPPTDPSRKVPPPVDLVSPLMDENIWAVGTDRRIKTYTDMFEEAQYPMPGDRTTQPLPGITAFHVVGY